MHKLLGRQLRQHFGAPENVPAELRRFIAAVEQAYLQSDDDRAMLEHSMETVSEELVDRFRRLNQALSESQLAKEGLNQAVSILSATLESTGDGILVVDVHGTIVQMNRKFRELWRVPDLMIEPGDEVSSLAFVIEQVADTEQFMRRIRDLGKHPDSESFDEVKFKDGRIFEHYSLPQRVDGEIVGRVWSFRDVTVRRQLEEQLRQSQKMEAVGALAGGVAHDFNNLLTVIRGHADLLADSLDPSRPERDDVDEIIVAAKRAAALTHHLLAFSRKQMLQPVPLDLNEVVASLAPMLRRLIDVNIEIALTPADDLGVITADPGQMEQVLMNLVVNARDAMPNGGRVSISTKNVVVEVGSHPEFSNGPPSGSFVLLTVSDTGHGIPVESRERVFEPFFTTKEVGKGTGLGLSTVFGIVKQSGGYLALESEVGRGTSFHIYFPLSAASEVSTSRNVAPASDRKGSEVVLVTEDEDAVRTLVRRVLEKSGYTVLTARDGTEALRLAAEQGDAIDLLLTDVKMPGIGGVELALQIRRICPRIRVLYMSGFAEDNADRRAELREGVNLIDKPFTGGELSRAVRSALDQARPERAG